MMHLLLVDSEIELTPWNRNELLDASIHHGLMRKYGISMRRGRPDIIHFFLMVSMESILNKTGNLRIYIHTRNNEIIFIKPETRIIKNYGRFKGLMVKLFNEGRVPPDNPLIYIKRQSLKSFLRRLNAKKILFTRKGKLMMPWKLEEVFEEEIACLIGGFSHGDFLTHGIETMVDKIISIHDEGLTAWSVAMEIITSYERFKFG